MKAEGQGYTILPGQILLGKLRSVSHLRDLHLPGQWVPSRRKEGEGEPGMVFWLQDVRSAPRPSSQTLSIAGSLARLINELFKLTLDLWSKSRALCGSY